MGSSLHLIRNISLSCLTPHICLRSLFTANERIKTEYCNLQTDYKTLKTENNQMKLRHTEMQGE